MPEPPDRVPGAEGDDLRAHVLETWTIAAGLNDYLLGAIDTAQLSLTLPTAGRSVGKQFGHLHDVRLMWLRAASKDLADGLTKAGDEIVADKAALRRSLRASATAVTALLERALTPGGRVTGFRPHPVAFVGYLIAHEAHHRSQIVIALKAAGHALPRRVTYGMWEWGSRGN